MKMTITLTKQTPKHKAVSVINTIHFILQVLFAVIVTADLLSLLFGIVTKEEHDKWFQLDGHFSEVITVFYIFSQVVYNFIWHFLPWLKEKNKLKKLIKVYNVDIK
jgi:hypothetical protein